LLTNFHTSMITYCLLQRHLVHSRSDEGSSGCQNVNNNNEKSKLYFDEFVNLLCLQARCHDSWFISYFVQLAAASFSQIRWISCHPANYVKALIKTII